ncbi:MAG: protein-disulfide reductase DsbD [Betaproteobacteria bacterium]|nr:protein-disulfide reductase DsbD [Betaproteobacteria bacterium]
MLACALLLCAPVAHALEASDLLEPEQAFRFSARALDGSSVEVRYRIARGYYMYRERFEFAAEPATVALGVPQFPRGEAHTDVFFGRTETYRNEVRIVVPVSAGARRFTLLVTSQGCADAGVCYPPQKQRAALDLVAAASSTPLPAAGATGRGVPASAASVFSSDTDIASLFQSGSFWLVMASFFGFGLLLAFTPCVLPMIPILSGIIIGEGRDLGKARALALSLAYVLGMALTYALAGVAATYSGTMLAAALQNPWVLTAFALVFVWLALAMFGWHEIQLPGFLHQHLHRAHHRLEGGRIASVAAMGVLSAVIVSPCVAAPLAGALLYISQSRDVVMGGAALFVMALGMGAPLLLVGVSEGALLPRSGPWMKAVKQFFGVLMLGVAIWIVSPVIPLAAQMLAWAALLIVWAMFMHAIDPLPADSAAAARIGKGIGVIALVTGVAMLVGALAGSRDPLRPLAGLFGDAARAVPVRFERVRTLAELDQRLGSAGRPVMLDFYADWCVSCKEMERDTFSDPRVVERLSRMLLLQADVTANSDDDKALLKRFRLFGPPGIIFFDEAGRENPSVRVIGFQPPARFLASLDRAVTAPPGLPLPAASPPALTDAPASSVRRPAQSK